MAGFDLDSGEPQRPPEPDTTGEIHAFLGAGFLVAVLLLPHARVLPVGGGIALAGALRWGWLRLHR